MNAYRVILTEFDRPVNVQYIVLATTSDVATRKALRSRCENSGYETRQWGIHSVERLAGEALP